MIQKVNSLSIDDKKKLLDTLAEPIGYLYDSKQDIFTTRADAPQKFFGYTTFYDLSAPYFNMVFDYETIYFNYNSRTWLIEFWKGQYGINTGCELGIYYADSIVSADEYASTLFTAVDTTDNLNIALELIHCPTRRYPDYTRLGMMQNRHWWLTIFKMGSFSKPQELLVNTAIHFKNRSMLLQFLESFEKTLPDTPYEVNGLTVSFCFGPSERKYSFFKGLVRHMALISCSIYCKWFRYVTRPFSNSGNKILYLYYYLPFVIRHLFKPAKQK
ncbi:MAG: DUF4474 domain-containing protein [Lachnospiraceae bacterium]|nr:DUF4474 domain-containing protein [Lachnospiraceae bacterium]